MGLLYKVTSSTFRPLAKLLYGHKVYGADRTKDVEGGVIIASSHASFLDPLLVAISYPKPMHFLARETLFQNCLLGSIIRRLNAHPIRGTATISAIRTVTRVLKDGQTSVIFPEGRRSSDGQLQEVQKGLGLIVSQSGCTVIPCYLHGTFELWPRTRRLPRLTGKTAAVFGRPLEWSAYSHLGKQEAQARLCADVEKSLCLLKQWYDAGAEGAPP